MDTLFGLPLNDLMIGLVVVFFLGVAVMSVVALRNRVMFKMAVRNVPRRRAQTALIVVGLMLATVLFSASFATGDTLTHSIRVQAAQDLGLVDVLVHAEAREDNGRRAYFDAAVFEQVREALSGNADVTGVAPMAREQLPVIAPETRLSEPRVDVLGVAEQWMGGFDPLVGADGATLSLGALAPGEIYLSRPAAEAMEVTTGDTVHMFLGPAPTPLTIAAVYEEGPRPAGEMALVMPLAHVQELVDNPGRINTVAISNRGDEISGARHTEAVTALLEPVLEGTGLEADPVKQSVLDEADEAGATMSSVFLLFGQFSIAAGILLIFLIFVMLAAERKHELGISRAVGAQRGHVVRLFVFEGAVYALIAAAIGSVLGMIVGWGMVRVMAVAFSEFDFNLVYTFNWRSLVIAYTLGVAFTFVVVLVSSWRVSRLNIVRAVRDIPEPRIQRRTLKGLVGMALLPVAGIFLAISGIQGEQMGTFGLGVSMIIIGAALLARRLGAPERVAFTAGGAGLVVFWLLPERFWQQFLPDMTQGIEMFFLTGIMLVIGGVWAVMYNSDILLKVLVLLVGRVRGMPPLLKTAVSYPMHNRFRTGMTLAMVSLVIFTLMVMAFVISSLSAMLGDVDAVTGGYHIQAGTSYANPIPDLGAALGDVEGLSLEDVTAIGGFNTSPVRIAQDGTGNEPVDFFIRGADAGYTGSVGYGLDMMAPEYGSAPEVWQALQEEPGTVLVAAWMVPSRTDFNVGGPPLPFTLEGFWREQGKPLPDVYINATSPLTGETERLRVIGIIESRAFYGGGLVASQETVSALTGRSTPAQTYMLRLRDGVDADAAGRALSAHFLEHGMRTVDLGDEVRRATSANLMVNNLLQGFMGLGLVVGIAALGVIAARSVVERRQQIGVLRALGFQKGMVRATFIIESSFIALLGIALGLGLGFGVAAQVIESFTTEFEGITVQVPWLNIALIAVIAYAASLLTTYLPAQQAARIYPAEALRYE